MVERNGTAPAEGVSPAKLSSNGLFTGRISSV